MFARTMTERVTIDRVVSLNDYSEPIYADPLETETFTAWINRNPREVRMTTAEITDQGSGTRSRTNVYLGQRVESDGSLTALADLTAPTAQDRLTLPDGSTPPIIEVAELRDPGGSRHVVLRL